MHQDKDDQNHEPEKGGEFANENVACKGEPHSRNSDPRYDYPEDDVERQIKRLGAYIGREWEEMSFFKRSELIATWIGLVTLIAYTGYTAAMYKANRESADAAKKSADVARDTLIASNRPWIKVEGKIIGPLSFDDSGAHLTVEIETSNIGHSPAVRVTQEEGFIQVFVGIPNPWDEIKRTCQSSAGASALPSNRGVSSTVFPGIPDRQTVALTLSREEMERKVAGWKPPYIYPVIVLCVAYQADFSKTIYHSGYAWRIVTKDPKLPGGVGLIDPKRGNTPMERLVIFPYWPFGPLAD